MKNLFISGWKQGVNVAPLTLMRVLRDILGLDLVKAKGLLDDFAEAGELVVSGDDDALDRFARFAQEEGLSVRIGEGESERAAPTKAP